jgi:hypothetical protein
MESDEEPNQQWVQLAAGERQQLEHEGARGRNIACLEYFAVRVHGRCEPRCAWYCIRWETADH